MGLMAPFNEYLDIKKRIFKRYRKLILQNKYGALNIRELCELVHAFPVTKTSRKVIDFFHVDDDRVQRGRNFAR